MREFKALSNRSARVEVRHRGTAGLTIATNLEGFDVAIFLDSTEMEGEPGSLVKTRLEVRYAEEDLELARLALHEVGLEGLLRFASAIGTLPNEIFLIGCKPKSLEPGLELSQEVNEAAREASEMVLEMLQERLEEV